MSSTALLTSFVVAAGLALASAGAALAADETSPTLSYKDVVAKGFEVRDVSIVVSPAADTLTATKNSDPQALVTLQLGSQTAVCIFNVLNWMNMVPASLNKPDRCSVY